MLQNIHDKAVLGIALYVFVTEYIVYYFKNRGTKLGLDEIQLLKEYQLLLRKEKTLDSVSMFVEHSKLQREMNQTKKKMDTLAMIRMQKNAPPAAFHTFQRYLKPFSGLMFAIYYWGVPAVAFSKSRLFPMETMYAIPGCTAGAISIAYWYMICHTVAKKVLS